MRYRRIAAMMTFVLIVAACDPQEELWPEAAQGKSTADVASEFAALDAAAGTDGNDWYVLAVRAREAGDTSTAATALDNAAALEYSTVRVGLERARLAVVDDAPDAAIGELQALADGGFTAVGIIAADPLLSSLAGRTGYDRLLATLSEQAYPCEYQEKFREFDFWVGEWEVHDANGTLAGHNVIEAAHRGCVLIENWTSASGGTGISLNFLDHEKDEWVQIWVDGSGGQVEIRGGLTDGGMQLSGKIHYTANDTTAPFRGLWTPLPDGRVRQFFEQSGDGGETWNTWFEGFYRRVDRAAAGTQ